MLKELFFVLLLGWPLYKVCSDMIDVKKRVQTLEAQQERQLQNDNVEKK